jgi:hypothetical protein
MSRCSLCCLLLTAAATISGVLGSTAPVAPTWTGSVAPVNPTWSGSVTAPVAPTWSGSVNAPVASTWGGGVVAPSGVIHVSGEQRPTTLTQWSTPVVQYRPAEPQYYYYYSYPAANPIGDLINAKLNFKRDLLGAVIRYKILYNLDLTFIIQCKVVKCIEGAVKHMFFCLKAWNLLDRLLFGFHFFSVT